MKTSSEALKVNMMDSCPKYKNLGIDEIVAISGLLTFKNETLEEYTRSEVDRKRVEAVHRESTKRGHASITTTPQFFFEVEGSRVVDLYGSAFPFGSFIMFSSRRIKVTPELLIRPNKMPESAWKSAYSLLKVYDEMWEAGSKDKARKILPIGFYSRGFMKFSAEDIIRMISETRSEHIPAELGLMAKKMGECFEKTAPSLFRAASEREVSLDYGHPKIFHRDKFRVLHNIEISKSEYLGEILSEFSRNKHPSLSEWKNFSYDVRDSIGVRTNLCGSIAVWNEVKRHRTMLQNAESIYDAADRAFDELNSLAGGEDPEWIHIPLQAPEGFQTAVFEALREYENLKDTLDERDAVYVVPHCVRLNFTAGLNGFHLFDPFGFFGVRECTTADYEVQEISRKLTSRIEEKMPQVKDLIGPKCKTGVCPEKISCGFVERYKVKA